MNSTKIGKIAVGVDGHKQAKFDLSHDSENTFNFGVVKPLFIKAMKPNSKISIKKKDLVMTAPFNVFTYGKILYETITQYVDRHKVFPRLDSFLSGEATSSGLDSVGDISSIVSAPATIAGILASFQLIGSKLNVWVTSQPVGALDRTKEILSDISYDSRDERQFKNVMMFNTFQRNSSASSIGRAAYNALVGEATGYGKLLRCTFKTTGDATSIPSANPNSTGHLFNNGEKSYTWLNLSLLNRLIQENNIAALSSSDKTLLPSGITGIIKSAYGGADVNTSTAQAQAVFVPLSNSVESIFGIWRADGTEKTWLDPQADSLERAKNEYVPEVIDPDNADVVIPYHFTYDGNTYLAFGCFKLSDAGVRFREILKGCEMPTDIGCSRCVNVEKLLAWYMCYYESFGIQTYENINNTNFGRLLNSMRVHLYPMLKEKFGSGIFDTNDDYRSISTFMLLNDSRSNDINHCLPFVLDLFDCWLTDTNDYASINSNTAVGAMTAGVGAPPSDIAMLYDYLHKPAFGWSLGKFISPNAASTITAVGGANSPLGPMLQQLNSAAHTEIDARLLMMASKWINRYTVTGHNTEKKLRVLGYGNIYDQFGANFVGKTSTELDITQVPSLADTYNSVTDDGRALGEIGAKSISFDKSRNMHYKSENGGFIVTMAYIRPVSSYSQCVDPEVYDCERSEEYLPDADGLGMEFTPMSAFWNTTRVASVAGTLKDPSFVTFGLVPRDTHRKMSRDVLNGGFDLPSRRGRYTSFHLNRYAPLGDFGRRTHESDGLANFGNRVLGFARPMVTGDLPKSGIWARSPYRYSWLNNLERIFAGHKTNTYNPVLQTPSYGDFRSNFFEFSDDNFILHCALLVTYSAPMKPVEVSYDTYEQDKGANGAMTKE